MIQITFILAVSVFLHHLGIVRSLVEGKLRRLSLALRLLMQLGIYLSGVIPHPRYGAFNA
jgi:hypothetical protein